MGIKVFKFGGASVKDATSLQNVVEIVQRFPSNKLVIVASAMGKTTNDLEEIMHACWAQNKYDFESKLHRMKLNHEEVLKGLFSSINHPIFSQIERVFTTIDHCFFINTEGKKYDELYDQIVSFGEVISTLILNSILLEANILSVWTDARNLIRTSSNFREGEVDWDVTEALMRSKFDSLFEKNNCIVIQGFLGHTIDGFTTTLGREGSDFTAGICAFCMNAESVTIWKDVPGMLNADPRKFENTIKLDKISFHEAIELSYYGASVIHPKTVKPLQNKNIPLYVKSFLDPEAEGTVIQSSTVFDHLVPSYITKGAQVLISITPRDFSFIEEENLSMIFAVLNEEKVKINLMQNSALSFSIACDQEKVNLETLKEALSAYEVRYNDNLELLTIRHYTAETISNLLGNKEIIVEQKTRQTARYLLKNG
jgi:aspartate kinase